MRSILASICLLMTIGTATAAEPSGDDKATVVSLVKEAIDAWSRNDIDTAKRHMSPSVVLLDSTAPYIFQQRPCRIG